MKTERNILEEYLGNSVERWKIAYVIMKYKTNKNMLDDIERKIVENFLQENSDNDNLAESIANNFKDILKDKIDEVSLNIVKSIIAKYRCETLEFDYEKKHHVNINLPNQIIIQLHYAKYPIFNLKNIWIQFYNYGENAKENKKMLEKKQILSGEETFYEKYNEVRFKKSLKFIDNNKEFDFLLIEENIQELKEKHKAELLSTINELTAKYEKL